MVWIMRETTLEDERTIGAVQAVSLSASTVCVDAARRVGTRAQRGAIFRKRSNHYQRQCSGVVSSV